MSDVFRNFDFKAMKDRLDEINAPSPCPPSGPPEVELTCQRVLHVAVGCPICGSTVAHEHPDLDDLLKQIHEALEAREILEAELGVT